MTNLIPKLLPACAVLAGVLGGVAVVATAQNTGASQAKPDPAASGVRLFLNNCASCHGVTGHGDGPAAASMRKAPTDLTKFAARNGGVFPAERLRRIIDGRDVPSHGTREMPVWGVELRMSRDSSLSPEARIDALVKYVQSIQERAAH